jgi:hypothetical protein
MEIRLNFRVEFLAIKREVGCTDTHAEIVLPEDA